MEGGLVGLVAGTLVAMGLAFAQGRVGGASMGELFLVALDLALVRLRAAQAI